MCSSLLYNPLYWFPTSYSLYFTFRSYLYPVQSSHCFLREGRWYMTIKRIQTDIHFLLPCKSVWTQYTGELSLCHPFQCHSLSDFLLSDYHSIIQCISHVYIEVHSFHASVTTNNEPVLLWPLFSFFYNLFFRFCNSIFKWDNILRVHLHLL